MIPADFEAEALYAPDAWFVHDVLEIDVEAGRVVGVIDTTRLGALVEAQRPHPGHHKHLPGAVAIQVTGTLGNLHAVYVLGLRPSQGWVGYGTHVREARFRRMGTIGPPVEAELQATRARRRAERRVRDRVHRPQGPDDAVRGPREHHAVPRRAGSRRRSVRGRAGGAGEASDVQSQLEALGYVD